MEARIKFQKCWLALSSKPKNNTLEGDNDLRTRWLREGGEEEMGEGYGRGWQCGWRKGRMVEGTEKGVDEGRDKGVVMDQRN